MTPVPPSDIADARPLAIFGDSITTDHISPAGAIKVDSPAGAYLAEHQVARADFNSYGARRGNHEVMMRGTFANIRIKNRMIPGTEGGLTRHIPTGEILPIYDAAMRYKAEGTPLVVIAGKEYGTGSSRDWAAKGTNLLGVRAVIAETYERIHRSNLVGMGVVPLQFVGDVPIFDGTETFIDHRNRRPPAAPGDRGSGDEGGRLHLRLHRPGSDRYAQRARIFPGRRNPPLRAEEAGRLKGEAWAMIDLLLLASLAAADAKDEPPPELFYHQAVSCATLIKLEVGKEPSSEQFADMMTWGMIMADTGRKAAAPRSRSTARISRSRKASTNSSRKMKPKAFAAHRAYCRAMFDADRP